MIPSLMLVGALLTTSSAPAYFYPSVNDTTVISFDLLHLSRRWGDLASFTCNWNDRPVHRDSIIWLLDGNLATSADVGIVNGPNSRDIPPEYSTGTTMGILPQADHRYFQGIHRVDVAVRFGDSTISGTWYFRYHETKYKEIRALVIIDSFWTTYTNLEGWHNFTKYKIAAAEGFDTSVFGNAYRSGDYSSIENDTAGIMREYLSELSSYAKPVPRDTIDCFILQILRGDSVHNEWLISDSIGLFLKISTAPFDLKEALRSFNSYVDHNRLYKGYTPPEGDLKIGPAFIFTPGDPGWSLHAYHDSVYWYLVLKVGYGDCPAGCTELRTNVYKIAGNGVVEALTSMTRNPGFSNFSSAFKPSIGSQSIFSLQGKRMGVKKCLSDLGKGVYFTQDQNKRGIKKAVIRENP